MKKLLILLLSVGLLFAIESVKPNFILKTSGGVTDIIRKNNLIYFATEASSVDVFDLISHKKIQSIKVSQIEDFMGDMIDSKIFSIDIIDDEVLILSQDESGFRRIHLYKNNKLNQIISKEDKLYIAKAKFVTKNQLLLGLLSNVIILYDINTKKRIWEEQISLSKFSNFVLNEDKTKVAIVDESGDLTMIRLKDGKKLKTFSGQNVDNVFQVDWKKNIIATAGQDRRCVVYNLSNNKSYYKQVNFLIYSVGVSPSGRLVGFASDEQNNVTIFDANTKTELYRLIDNKINISNIFFLDDKNVIVTTDGKEVNLYKL
jgi:WD40 repeat protein